MKILSYDFNLPKENMLTKDLPSPSFRRGFQHTLDSFIRLINIPELGSNPRLPDILGRFLAAHSPIFSFFLIGEIQEEPLRSFLINAFRERSVYLDELKGHCNRALGPVIEFKDDLLTVSSKCQITILANDLYQLTEKDIDDIGYGHPVIAKRQLKDKSLLAYDKAFNKCMSGVGDSRDLTILIYSFVAAADSDKEFLSRLSFIQGKTKNWFEKRRKIYNCLGEFKDFVTGLDIESIGISLRTINELIRIFEPVPVSSLIHGFERNQPRGYGHPPRVYNSAPKINDFNPLDITDLVNPYQGGMESEAVFVKINYNRISGSLNETRAFHAARAAIDFLLEFRNFRNDGERNVRTLAAFVSYFDPRTSPELINEAVMTFKANTSLLNNNELYWAYVALIPWLPVLPNNSNRPSVIIAYNKFRQDVKDYVNNFHR